MGPLRRALSRSTGQNDPSASGGPTHGHSTFTAFKRASSSYFLHLAPRFGRGFFVGYPVARSQRPPISPVRFVTEPGRPGVRKIAARLGDEIQVVLDYEMTWWL
jgi:hypothetical protein